MELRRGGKGGATVGSGSGASQIGKHRISNKRATHQHVRPQAPAGPGQRATSAIGAISRGASRRRAGCAGAGRLCEGLCVVWRRRERGAAWHMMVSTSVCDSSNQLAGRPKCRQ